MPDPTNTAPKPTFLDPYASVPQTNQRRLVSWVDQNEWNRIYACCPIRGTQQIVINSLIHKLYDALTSRGITDFTKQDEFQRFVSECQLTTPGNGSTVARSLPPTEASNDRTGTARRSPTDKAIADVSANISSTSRSGGTGTTKRIVKGKIGKG